MCCLWRTQVLKQKATDSDENASGEFTHFESIINLYMSFKQPNISILALRFGLASNSGDYPFIFANSLGGRSNLRGYYRTRFTGDQMLFQNTELRFRLFNFRSYLVNGQIGCMLFHDIGRVWLNQNDTSEKWHYGYGGGIWFAPFKRVVLRATYQQSAEARLFELRGGFLF